MMRSQSIPVARSRRIARSRFAMLLALVLTMLPGCSGTESAPTADPGATGASTQAHGEGIELTVRISAREVDVGQPVTLTLDVLADPAMQVELPAFADDVLGAFEIRNTTRMPPIPEGEKRRWRMTIELMTLDEGSLDLPGLTVTYRGGGVDSEEKSLTSAPLTMQVRSVLGGEVDPAQYRDIKGPADMPRSMMWIVWIVVGIAALLFVLALAIVIWRLIGRKPARADATLAPHAWALQELERLTGEQLPERGAFEPFYVRVSGIVREYLERGFGLMAPERTTDEFLRDAARSRSLSESQRESLGVFLRAADMVKFARYQPTLEDCRGAISSARQFVEQTAATLTTAASSTEPHAETNRAEVGA